MQLITKTLTRTHERAVQGHGKEVLDILHGRMWTRPIDHQAKHLKGAVNGLYEDTGKNWPTAVVDGS